ncbi:MAG: hypothetical protein J6P78_04115 [Lachnospiraceae bacterium]|nr:hypothetical protein [Lachnospiraceae bacterium]
MTIKEFSGNMKQAVSMELGSGYKVEEVSVDKNNGVTLEALLIKKEGLNLSPTIYLNSYYEKHLGGENLHDVAGRMVRDYRSALPEEGIDISFFLDYEQVKERLAFKLISSELNTELLNTVPHVPFLDLEITFYYSVETDGMDGGSILIRNTHMESWGVGTGDLMRDSLENAPRILPGICRDIFGVMERMCPEKADTLTDDMKDLGLYVISNERLTLGAAVMIYPGMMEKVSDMLGGNIYIIPSSIHELIALSAKTEADPEYLRDMIRLVNRTQLMPQDVLSDSLYFFDRETGKITIA